MSKSASKKRKANGKVIGGIQKEEQLKESRWRNEVTRTKYPAE